MSRARRSGWLAWTALVVYALVGLVPVRGIVLCIGEDGHFAIEAATAEAACFDCPTESPSVESCCSDTDEQGSSCTCTDFLILAGNPVPVRVVTVHLVDLAPPACGWVNPGVDSITASLRALDHAARSAAPPCPRVPTNLILRV